MKIALSPEEALAEVKDYTGLSLSADEIQSLYEILTVPRNDTAILSHLRAAHHLLGDLPHMQDGENWWDKVHTDMLTADDPYIDQSSGSHKNPAPNDRNAVIFWLKHRILPALTGEDAASGTSNGTPGPGHKISSRGRGNRVPENQAHRARVPWRTPRNGAHLRTMPWLPRPVTTRSSGSSKT